MSVLQWGETISKGSFKFLCIMWIFNDVLRDQYLGASYPGEKQIGNILPVFNIIIQFLYYSKEFISSLVRIKYMTKFKNTLGTSFFVRTPGPWLLRISVVWFSLVHIFKKIAQISSLCDFHYISEGIP